MKRCPQCNRTYADETLAFCLADGALLSAPFDPQATVRLPQSRSTNEAPTEVLPGGPNASQLPRPDRSKFIYVAIALIAVAMAVIAMFLLQSRGPNSSKETALSNINQSPSPLPTASVTPEVKSTPKPDSTPSPTVENKPNLSFLTGTYSLYPLQNPSSEAIGQMAITVRAGNKIFVRGADWKGSGVMTDGKQGYYDWEFEDGKHGRTTILINEDGSLQGRVFGSGLDWWYLARLQK